MWSAIYTGKDVRQALFNVHKAGQFGKVGYIEKNGKPMKPEYQHPKVFKNYENIGSGARPIPHMKGEGIEFGLKHNSKYGYDGVSPNPSAARLVAQKDSKGVVQVMGVLAHPKASRNDRWYNDHVLVPPT